MKIPPDYTVITDSILSTLGYTPSTGAELGVREGYLSHSLLKSIPSLTMYSVDLWGENDCIDESHNHETNYSIAISLLTIFEHRSIIKRSLTTVAVNEIEDSSLDFVIIDATHTYDAVLNDINQWAPKIKETGWLFGHDYVSGWQGVIDAVNESVNSMENLVMLPYTFWAFKKINIKT